MKKTLFGLLAVATVVGFAVPANADTLYVNSDGSFSTLSTDSVIMPDMTTQVITQPAVIEPTVVSTPTVVSDPVLIERRHRDHLLNVGIPGLFGVHLF